MTEPAPAVDHALDKIDWLTAFARKVVVVVGVAAIVLLSLVAWKQWAAANDTRATQQQIKALVTHVVQTQDDNSQVLQIVKDATDPSSKLSQANAAASGKVVCRILNRIDIDTGHPKSDPSC